MPWVQGKENTSNKAGYNVISISEIQHSHAANKYVTKSYIVSICKNAQCILAGTVRLLTLLLLFPASAWATLTNVTVSSNINQAITLNLSQSISNISEPVVTIPAQPESGSATVVSCGDSTLVCVNYQPALNFQGQVSFSYAVHNDQSITETATITINVGDAAIPDQGSAPGTVINNTLANACLDQSRTDDLCEQFRIATFSGLPEDLREFVDATSPTNVGAQSTLTDELTKEQLSNISRRLASLRQGQKLTLLSGLTLDFGDHVLSGDILEHLLRNNANGGSAGTGLARNWEWFISGKIGGGTQDETIYETGFELDNLALTLGADARIGKKAIIGWALGYGQTDMTIDHDGGGMDMNDYSATAYGSYFPTDNSYIDAIAVVKRSDFDMQRRVTFGTTDETARSNTDSTGYAITVGGGYDFVRGGFTSSLNARLDYLETTIDGYRESGADSFNLAIRQQQVSQLVSSLGTQLRYAASYPWGVLVPYVNVSWLRQFDDSADEVAGYFLIDPSTQFSFETNTPATSYYLLAVGTSATFAGGVSSYIQYETTVNQDNLTLWNVAGGLRLEW